MNPRKPPQASFDEAKEALGLFGEARFEVQKRPRHDDEEPGPSIFRSRVEGARLARLTLAGLFVGRSELLDVSLTDCDLHLSNLCWNDFKSCSFDSSSLADSDLRRSYFENCSFRETDLARADLRGSTFKNCDFRGANLTGAIATGDFKSTSELTPEQASSMLWNEGPGEEPDGG
jgi:uncharacterized protein YjbI with pentapeptide repeats